MTNISVLIADLQARGVVLSLAGDEVRFRAPAGALTDADKDALRARRGEIIAFLAAREAARGLRHARGRSGPLTASVAQEMWYRFAGGPDEGQPVALNVSTIGRFDGADPRAVTDAIHDVMRRHDTLRTRIRVDGEALHLSLSDVDGFTVAQDDLTGLSPDDAVKTAEQQLRGFCSELIPIEGEWQTRARIWKLPGGVLTAIASGHIVADAGSRNIIMNELLDAVGHGQDRGQSAAPQPFMPYNDFALVERDHLTGPQGQTLIGFWKRWYDGVPVLLSPQDKTPLLWGPGPRIVNNFVMPRRVLAGVRRLAEQLRTTSFAVHLTLFSTALGRWSGAEDFALRILGDKRTSLELSGTVGLMFCADPILVHAPAGAGFDSVLRGIMKEYDASLALRLPALHFYPPQAVMPGIEPLGHRVKIPAVFNYYAAGTEREKLAAQTAPDETADLPWPPPLQTLPPALWTRPSAPVFLHLMDMGGQKADCSLQFFAGVVSAAEQRAFIETLFAVYQEFLPA